MIRIFKNLRGKLKSKRITRGETDDYVLSEKCQIQGLSGLYKLFLGYKETGCFVEFGAYDGEFVSNTSGLADLGWKGLYIEPVKEYFDKCVKRHQKNNQVRVLNCAVGDSEKVVEISVGGQLSSISKSTVELFNKLSWSQGYHKGQFQTVRQYTLDSLLEQENISVGFDILSIDVEGYEWEVFRGFNVEYWKPKIIIVELHDNNKDYLHEWESCQKISQILIGNSYRIVYKDYSNTVFVVQSITPRKES